MTQEKLEFTINKKRVKIVHDYSGSGRAFKDQEDGADQIKAFLKDEIIFGEKTNGFIPYNNFESSVTWEVLKWAP